jgi:hypothetical protein
VTVVCNRTSATTMRTRQQNAILQKVDWTAAFSANQQTEAMLFLWAIMAVRAAQLTRLTMNSMMIMLWMTMTTASTRTTSNWIPYQALEMRLVTQAAAQRRFVKSMDSTVMTKIVVMAQPRTIKVTTVRMTLKPAFVRSMAILAVTRTTAMVLPRKQAWLMMTEHMVAIRHHGQKTKLSTRSSQCLRVLSKPSRLLMTYVPAKDPHWQRVLRLPRFHSRVIRHADLHSLMHPRISLKKNTPPPLRVQPNNRLHVPRRLSPHRLHQCLCPVPMPFAVRFPRVCSRPPPRSQRTPMSRENHHHSQTALLPRHHQFHHFHRRHQRLLYHMRRHPNCFHPPQLHRVHHHRYYLYGSCHRPCYLHHR